MEWFPLRGSRHGGGELWIYNNNPMVRLLISIFFLAATVSGGSKGNYFFPEFAFKEIKLKELNKENTLKIVKGLKDYGRIFGPADIYDTVNHFYSSDIDNDKKNELIYFGLVRADGYWTIIWKPDGPTYQLIGELYGRINGISDSLYISTLAIATFTPQSRTVDLSYAYLYRKIEDSFDFLRSVAIFKGMTLPDCTPTRKKIVIQNSDCFLRAHPVINDAPDSSAMDRFGILRGNAIVELDSGAAALATAIFKDRAKNEWWFLILDNPPNSNYNVFKDYRKENQGVCGWMDGKEISPGR
jgi:hypothetical protein